MDVFLLCPIRSIRSVCSVVRCCAKFTSEQLFQTQTGHSILSHVLALIHYGGAMNRFDRHINPRQLPKAALIGAAIGVVANLIVYAIARAGGLEFSAPVPPTNQPMPLPVVAVVVSTVIPAIGAAVLLALLNRFTSRPLRVFLICAGVVLVLSFAGPFTLPVSLLEQMILNLMHVIAAGAIVWALVNYTVEE
jgi:hypothetical protein